MAPSIRRGRSIWVPLFLALAWTSPSLAGAAEDPREAIPVPTAEVFERLLLSAETGQLDPDRVRKALDLLQPLIGYLNQRYGTRIDQELTGTLERKDAGGAVKAIQQLAALSIQSLLTEGCALARDRAGAVPKVKAAYVEYLVLDYYVRKIDFETSKILKQHFRTAHVTAGVKPEEFAATCQEIQTILQRLFGGGTGAPSS